MEVSCAKLTEAEIRHSTRILRCEGLDTGACADADANLPWRLKQPNSSHRLASIIPSFFTKPLSRSRSASRRSSDSPGPRLCARLHAPRNLNAYTIHSLFTRLVAEVGPNLDSLVALLHSQGHRWLVLSARQREVVQRLRGLHDALGLHSNECRKTAGRARLSSEEAAPPPGGKQWGSRFQEKGKGCEACILAHVGGDRAALLDLRIVLLSRTRTPGMHRRGGGQGQPTLLVFVEAWLEGLGVAEGVLRENWEEAQRLKGVRKGVWRERRWREGGRERRRRSGAPEPESEKEEELHLDLDLDGANFVDLTGVGGGNDGGGSVDPDFEMEIIDAYAAATSTLHLPSSLVAAGSGSETDLDPDPEAVSTSSSTLQGSGASTTSEMTTTTPVATCRNQTMTKTSRSRRAAEDWARSYQDLIALPSP